MRRQIFDQFSQFANPLRQVFEQKFADPLETHRDRFVWDFWHVPNEYTLMRTPAVHYFPKKIYEKFHNELVLWGRETLGCHDVSPPWLSCYIEGCRQEPHQDIPHGPIAYVYSLTPWANKKFRGGETFLQKGKGVELIAPKFNRLIIFNPAITHGVRQVKGTLDPRFGRLVIHGWFVNPRPFWYGPLKASQVDRVAREGIEALLYRGLKLGKGMVSLRINIRAQGEVESVKVVANTLSDTAEKDVRLLLTGTKSWQFPKSRRATQLTLPLVVD